MVSVYEHVPIRVLFGTVNTVETCPAHNNPGVLDRMVSVLNNGRKAAAASVQPGRYFYVGSIRAFASLAKAIQSMLSLTVARAILRGRFCRDRAPRLRRCALSMREADTAVSVQFALLRFTGDGYGNVMRGMQVP